MLAPCCRSLSIKSRAHVSVWVMIFASSICAQATMQGMWNTHDLNDAHAKGPGDLAKDNLYAKCFHHEDAKELDWFLLLRKCP